MSLHGYLKVLYKSDTLVDVKVQGYVPYFGCCEA